MKKNYLQGTALNRITRYRDIRELLRDRITATPEAEAYIYKEGADRHDVVKTYLQFGRDIDALGEAILARDLVKLGRIFEPEALVDGRNPYNTHDGGPVRRPVDALAVMGENSYRWTVAYAAYLFGLGVAVPLDRDLQAEEALGLAKRAEITILAFGDSHRAIAQHLAENCQSLHTLVDLDGTEVRTLTFGQREVQVLPLSLLVAEGDKLIAAGSRRFHDLEINPYDLAAIFFTSGTTAMAKGVMLSHFNMASDLWAGHSIIQLQGVRRTLSVLPLHHTFENIVGSMACWQLQITVCFNDKLRYLTQNLKDWDINMIFMVPLILENIQRSMLTKIEKQGKTKLVQTMLTFTRAMQKVGIDLRKPVFKSLRAALAPNLHTFVLGGASLNPATQSFFLDLGYDVWNAYGLTETAPGLTAGNEKTAGVGSVGRVCAGFELRIDADSVTDQGDDLGEVVVKTDSIMLGYYRDPETTAQVIDPDGWFHTGDLGYIRGECLYLGGRAKSMIVLGNGKNIFPEELENLIKDSIPEVENAFVWAEDNHRDHAELVARLQLDRDYLAKFEGEAGQAELKAYLAGQFKAINQKVPSYKAIKHYFWTSQAMVTTTTRKLKRRDELQRVHQALAEAGLEILEAGPRALDLEEI